MAARALSAIGSAGRETSVALAANLLIAVVLGREHFERRLNDTTAETEDKVERGLLLDIVVRQGATILQLLPGKDQALLVWRDAFLVLNLGLDIVNGVGRLHL